MRGRAAACWAATYRPKHPSGLWIQPRDALGRGGVRAVLKHRRPWDGRTGGRPAHSTWCAGPPPSSPPQSLPVHTWEGSTLAHVWRRGQGTGGDSWVCLQATWPLGSVTLGNAGSGDVQPFRGFCKDEMKRPASRSAHVQGQQDQPPVSSAPPGSPPPTVRTDAYSHLHVSSRSRTVGHPLRRQATRHPVGKQTVWVLRPHWPGAQAPQPFLRSLSCRGEASSADVGPDPGPLGPSMVLPSSGTIHCVSLQICQIG